MTPKQKNNFRTPSNAECRPSHHASPATRRPAVPSPLSDDIDGPPAAVSQVRGAVPERAALVRHGRPPVPHVVAAGRARAGAARAPAPRRRHGGRARQAETQTAAGVHAGWLPAEVVPLVLIELALGVRSECLWLLVVARSDACRCWISALRSGYCRW